MSQHESKSIALAPSDICPLCRLGRRSFDDLDPAADSDPRDLDGIPNAIFWDKGHRSRYRELLNARIKGLVMCEWSFGLGSYNDRKCEGGGGGISVDSKIPVHLCWYANPGHVCSLQCWWAPARVDPPTKDPSYESAKHKKSVYLYSLPESGEKISFRTNIFNQQSLFDISSIYKGKPSSYIKRGVATPKLVALDQEGGLQLPRLAVETVWEGNCCVIIIKRFAGDGSRPLEGEGESRVQGGDWLVKRSFMFDVEKGCADLHKGYKNNYSKKAKEIKFDYTQVEVRGILDQFKPSSFDRFHQRNDFLLQACFVDRFGDKLPPRYGQKRRRNTYRYGQGKYVMRDINPVARDIKSVTRVLKPAMRDISPLPNPVIPKTGQESGFPTVTTSIFPNTKISNQLNSSQINLRWPLSIKNYERHYKVDQDKLSRLIEKIRIAIKKKRSCTITVFLSSPFDGCDDERKYFKLNFESLKTYCSRKGVFLRLINYQWGITNHLMSENKTIFRCLEAADKADIFIGYLGARYGSSTQSDPKHGAWMDPSIKLCVDSPCGRFRYLDAYRDRSVTEMEWQHTFLHHDHSTRPDKPIPFFLFRDSDYDSYRASYLDKAVLHPVHPDDNEMRVCNNPDRWYHVAKKDKWYLVENDVSREAMHRLKEDVRVKVKTAPSTDAEAFASVFEDYLDPDQGAQIMYACCDTLMKSIIKSLDCGDLDEAYLSQLAFVNSRLTFYSDLDDSLRTNIDRYVRDGESRVHFPFVITGARGSGKSSLLANTVNLLLNNPNFQVIYHFCGCDKSSSSLPCLLDRVYKEFIAFIPEEHVVHIREIMVENNALKEYSFNRVFESIDQIITQLREILPTFVFVLDGIDQLEEIKYRCSSDSIDLVNYPSGLEWLPSSSFRTYKMKIVIGCTEDSKALTVLKSRKYSINSLQKLASDKKKMVVLKWHEEYQKGIDETKMQKIYDSKECENVMFLSIVLNQLLVNGTYKSMILSSSLLERLLESKSIPELMQDIIRRSAKLLQDKLSVDVLEKVMCYIYCSRSGLSCDELKHLLVSKYPQLKKHLNLLDEIKYEDDVPSILNNRLNMITVDHKFVLEAIEQLYILNGNTFKRLAEDILTVSDPKVKKDIKERIHVGKTILISYHKECAEMFKLKAGEKRGGNADEFTRELQELDYHEREAKMRPSVITAIRCRPVRSSSLESADKQPIVKIVGKNIILRNPITNDITPFDKCNLLLHESTSQEKVYEACGKDIVEQVLSGNNASIIAYGQTGSGKTYTMLGPTEDLGLVPRVVSDIIRGLKERGHAWNLACSAVEIYKEVAFDLLALDFDSKRSPLKSKIKKAFWFPEISLESIETEMKKEGFDSAEALVQKIAELEIELPSIDRESVQFNSPTFDSSEWDEIKWNIERPYITASKKIFLLKDIMKRYDSEKAKLTVKQETEEKFASYDALKSLQEEIEGEDFDDFEALVKYISDPTKLGNSKLKGKIDRLKDLQRRYTSELLKIAPKVISEGENSTPSVNQGPVYDVGYFQSDSSSRKLKEFKGIAFKDFKEFNSFMTKLYSRRRVASTIINDVSSRSHLVITLHIYQQNMQLENDNQEVKLTLVDLAGSESALKIGCDQMDETIATNRSLFALKKCIKALSKSENKGSIIHIFRESLLTKILQDTLAGLKNKLLLIGNVGCQSSEYEETKSTLKYVSLAGNISNGREILAANEATKYVAGTSTSLSEKYAYTYTNGNELAANDNALLRNILDYLDIVQCDQYKIAFLSASWDEVKLRDVCKDGKSLDAFLSVEIGVADKSHRQLMCTMLQSINNKSCLHLCVEKWLDENKIGRFLCNQCFKYFNYDDGKAGNLDHYENLRDADREAREREIESRIVSDFIPLGLSREQRMDYIGELSQNRGIPIGWLLDFTNRNDCWDLTTQEVCRRFVFPSTAARRCRYVELDHMRGITGPASTFISHCRGSTWGDLVAAVSEGDADRSRRVWIDIFACRQWPSFRPDLDFDSTIRHCSSFLVVCSSLREVVKLDFQKSSSTQSSNLLSKHSRSKIAFLRVWNLVEIFTASQCVDLPIMIKGGNYKRGTLSDGSIYIKFDHNIEMLRKMSYLIDINNAEATVPEDKEAILKMIGGEDAKGLEKLNITIRGLIISSCFSTGRNDENGDSSASVILQNAACGDRRPLARVNASPFDYLDAICLRGFSNLLENCILRNHSENLKTWPGLVEALTNACLGGHINIVRKLIELGADINTQREDGWTSLMRACFGGHTNVAILLLKNGADVNAKKKDGRTSLEFACQGGHSDIVKLLIHGGAEVNDKNKYGAAPLEYACQGGYKEIVVFLIECGADVNSKNASGDTAIMKASEGGFLNIIKLLVESGADANAKNYKGKSTRGYAMKNGHGECAEYLKDIHKLRPWQILLKPANAIDSRAIPAKLNEIGLSSDEQMRFLEEEEVKELAEMLRRESREEFLAAWYKTAKTTTTSSSSSSSSSSSGRGIGLYADNKQIDYSAAWDVIATPENAIDSDALLLKLIKIGLSQSDQLQYLEEKDVKEIAAMLKMIPNRDFVWKIEAAVKADDFANADTRLTIDGYTTNISATQRGQKYREDSAQIIADSSKHDAKINSHFDSDMPKQNTTAPLQGMVIAITGTLSVLRTEFQAFIHQNGGSTSSNVTEKVTHLVAAEVGTNKYQDAEARGVMIVDETFVRDLVDSVGGGGGGGGGVFVGGGGEEGEGDIKKVKRKDVMANEANREYHDALEEIADLYFQRKDNTQQTLWKGRAFSNGAKSIRECTTTITSKKEVKSVVGIGEAMAAYWEELKTTGVILKLEELRARK